MKAPMDYKKKIQKPNFSELYKEKMDKMRVPGKIDLKGSQTKTDSTKASDAMREEPVLWGLTKKHPPTKLDEAHFKDALDRMKESGVKLKGREDEPSVNRIIKTITEDSSEESPSDISVSSKDSYDSDREMPEEERLLAEKLLKQLQTKKEQPYQSQNISELRKPYMSWLEKEKRSLKLKGRTKLDGASRKIKPDRKVDLIPDILSSESEPSEASSDTSEVESDKNDPFSQTPEGKDIMRKMKKIKTSPRSRTAKESDLKRKMRELNTEGRGFRPSLEGVASMYKPAADFCALAKAQAESRDHREWIGEVEDVETLWFKGICEASQRGGESSEEMD